METHVVESVLLALAEDAQPFLFVCGGIASEGETAVLHCAAQEQRTVVEEELTPLDADVAQTEGHRNL